MSNPVIQKVDATLAVSVIDAFLDWCQKNQAPRTYDWYKMHVGSFAAALPSPETFKVSEVTPYAVTSWISEHPSWGPSFRRGAITAVQRVFNWAEKVKLIPQSPIRHIEKPQTKQRELHIDQKEFDRVLSFYSPNNPFRQLLVFAWESGVRPQEARLIKARHFVPDRQRFEIPKDESKGKKRRRVIHLTDAAVAVVKRQIEKHRDGILFRNEDGATWTAEAINCRFCRLKPKIGYKLCAYVIRHSFCQRMLEAGLDSVTVAALMGHADAGMVQKIYSHMNQSQGFLGEQLRRAVG
jgi:integrase